MTVDPGLCLNCVHARTVRGARTTFWLCDRSRTDPSYPRYPRLPVQRCAGYSRLLAPTPTDEPGDGAGRSN